MQPLIPGDVQYRQERQFLISGSGVTRRDNGAEATERAAKPRDVPPRRDALDRTEAPRDGLERLDSCPGEKR